MAKVINIKIKTSKNSHSKELLKYLSQNLARLVILSGNFIYFVDISQERKGPLLPHEELKLRGEELKNLNS